MFAVSLMYAAVCYLASKAVDISTQVDKCTHGVALSTFARSVQRRRALLAVHTKSAHTHAGVNNTSMTRERENERESESETEE
jgi:hypothetical protein